MKSIRPTGMPIFNDSSSNHQNLNVHKAMKEKRLNCERARTVSIVDTMAKLGHFPVRETEKEAWFLSPLRSETQASFKVSKTLNRWYDHGEGIGGNLIDLLCQLQKCSVREALGFLQNQDFDFSFQQPPSFKGNYQKQIVIKKVKPIGHAALIDYLSARKIQLSKVHQYVKEVHFTMNNKNFFAIGFQNDKGGWELRNSFQKLCSSPKAITHLKKGNDSVTVFEGFFDFLSALIFQPQWMVDNDYLVLNSLAFANSLEQLIAGYTTIYLALDNDSAGSKATTMLQRIFPKAIDCRSSYEGFKDINEKLLAWD